MNLKSQIAGIGRHKTPHAEDGADFIDPKTGNTVSNKTGSEFKPGFCVENVSEHLVL